MAPTRSGVAGLSRGTVPPEDQRVGEVLALMARRSPRAAVTVRARWCRALSTSLPVNPRDRGVHLLEVDGNPAWPVQHPLELPDVHGGRSDDHASVVLDDEIDGIARL